MSPNSNLGSLLSTKVGAAHRYPYLFPETEMASNHEMQFGQLDFPNPDESIPMMQNREPKNGREYDKHPLQNEEAETSPVISEFHLGKLYSPCLPQKTVRHHLASANQKAVLNRVEYFRGIPPSTVVPMMTCRSGVPQEWQPPETVLTTPESLPPLFDQST